MGFLEISLEGIGIDHFILKLELLFSIIKTLLSLLTIQIKFILLSLDGGLMLCFKQFLLLSEFISLILKADNILINLNFFLSLQKIYILFLLPDLVRDIRLQFGSSNLVLRSGGNSLGLESVLFFKLSLHVTEKSS